MELFSCQKCSFRCPSWRSHIRHAFEAHSSEPNFSFRCDVNGCTKTTNNYSTLMSHISRQHGGVDIESPTVHSLVTLLPDDNAMEIDYDHDFSRLDWEVPKDGLYGDARELSTDPNTAVKGGLKRCAALFLLTLKEKYQLTQSALDFMVSQVKQMMFYDHQDKMAIINTALHNQPHENFCLEYNNPFTTLETEHLQMKYYRENFGLVDPISVELDKKMIRGTGGILTQKVITYQYVPLEQSLKSFLSNQEIRDEVLRSHAQSDGILADFCDGSFYKNHSFLQKYPDALQIIAYFDEIEVCNPLGSRAGVHKLGMFYYSLANLPPHLRSTQQSTLLLACVSSTNIVEYGFERILQHFIDDVNELTERGLTVAINGVPVTLRVTLVAFLADTLAAHQLGGFKISVGWAFRKCCDCLATRSDLQCKFLEEELTLRDIQSYDYHCDLLEGVTGADDSVTYGINYRSPLNSIQNYHVASGQLPQDVMHVLFEGVLLMEIKLLLKQFIYVDKYFDLHTLCSRITHFTYGRNEARNKPPKSFEETHVTGNSKLPLSAAQVWTFVMILPLLIGDLIPLDHLHWECFLLLLEITKNVTARLTSLPIACYVAALVHQHHENFKQCYPSISLTPKFHYMVHFASQMTRMGPLQTSWCMRMEAKNNYFKKAGRIGNFKNVPFSVAKRHQKLLTAFMQGKFFTYNDLDCGACGESTALSEEPLLQEILVSIPDTDLGTLVSRPNWIKTKGEYYHRNDFVLVSWQQDDLPQFAKIRDILVINDTPLLLVEKYNTLGINNHILCHLIECTFQSFVQSISGLIDTHTFTAHTYLGDQGLYIAMPSYVLKT